MSVFDNLKTAGATATASGTFPIIKNSANGKMKNLKLFGESTQAATPTPDNPQPIESKVVCNIVSHDEQLFDKNNALYVLGISADVNEGIFKDSQPQVRIYYVEANPNTTYTFSKTIGGFNRVCTCPNIPSESGKITNFNADTTNNVATITTGENDRYIAFYPLLVSEVDSIGYDAAIDTFMLNYGTEALPYKHYKANIANLPESFKLNGIGEVKDYIDSERGVAVQKISVAVFDGSSDEYWYKENNYFKISRANTVVNTNLLCTHLIQTKEYNVVNSTSGTIYIGSSTFSINISEICSKVDELRIWLARNPITVIHESAEQIETPLSPAALLELNKLRTFDSTTCVSNDAGAEMEIEYFKNNATGQAMSDIHSSIPQFVLDGVDLHIIV